MFHSFFNSARVVSGMTTILRLTFPPYLTQNRIIGSAKRFPFLAYPHRSNRPTKITQISELGNSSFHLTSLPTAWLVKEELPVYTSTYSAVHLIMDIGTHFVPCSMSPDPAFCARSTCALILISHEAASAVSSVM